jgi:hypothetical protein
MVEAVALNPEDVFDRFGSHELMPVHRAAMVNVFTATMSGSSAVRSIGNGGGGMTLAIRPNSDSARPM